MFSADDVEEMIGDREYVSFDIYDTLLIRPYVKPADLFRHAELISGKKGFSESRVSAERRARIRYRREITLEEIYGEIDPEYRSMKDLEIGLETSVPVANAQICGLLNSLREKGKSIILISDMYLPRSIIEQVLERCGISYHMLYVSSEYEVTKHGGSLFEKAMSDLGIGPEQLFHIGDNKHSDRDVPVRLGISSYLYQRPI